MNSEPTIPFELELLTQAVNYQRWTADRVRPFLGQRILEVGSGLGNMSRWLPARQKLVLSEADPHLLPLLKRATQEHFRGASQVEIQTIDLNVSTSDQVKHHALDTIVSFNVLEHVLDDQAALADFVRILRASPAPGPKRVVSLVPAHPWAMGTIDRSYGHYRRYSVHRVKEIAQAIAPDCRLYLSHFNVFGLPGWFLMNRVLHRTELGRGSIRAFEAICPAVRWIDDFLHKGLRLPLGQSLLAVITLPDGSTSSH